MVQLTREEILREPTLSRFINWHIKKDTMKRYPELFDKIERNPITINTITGMRNSWLIYASYQLPKDMDGRCNREGKEIQINPRLTEYVRDITLFHELVHANYDFLDHEGDNFYGISQFMTVEWLARNLRKDPVLLRHTVDSFGLERYIYDEVSRVAFGNNH